jgi:hypothetical protein
MYVYVYIYRYVYVPNFVLTDVIIHIIALADHMQPCAHKTPWTQIPDYTSFQFTATFDTPPQIAVNKQWRFDGVCSIVVSKTRKWKELNTK